LTSNGTGASPTFQSAFAAGVDISTDTNLSAGTNITLSGDTLNVDDVFVLTAGDIMTGALVLDDVSLQIQEGTDTLSILVPALSVDRSVSFPDRDGEVSLLGFSIEVTELAVQTTGVVITWDTSGNALTVGPGTAGEVLTSNGTGASPTFQSAFAAGVDISTDTNLSAGTNITLSGDTLNVDDVFVLTAGDIMTGALVLDDVSLQIQEGTDTLSILVPTLTVDRSVSFPDRDGEVSLLGFSIEVTELAVQTTGVVITWDTSGNALTVGPGTSGEVLTSNGSGASPTFQSPFAGGVDISTDTNLSAGTNITLSGDTLNVDDVFVLTAGDIMTGALVLDDVSLQIQEGTDTLSILVPTLTVDRSVSFPDRDGEVSLLGFSIEVTELAVQTTGVVITWDTSGNALTVGPGTAGEVLTSNGTGASPTFQSPFAGGVDISTDTNLSAGTNITLSGDTLNVDDVFVLTAGDIMTGALVLDDVSLQIQEGTDTLSILVPTLTVDRSVSFPDRDGEVSLLGFSIEVTELAVQTTGVVITWDTSGNALTVGPGTAGEVLTSNGTGASPTFQSPFAGGVDISTDTNLRYPM